MSISGVDNASFRAASHRLAFSASAAVVAATPLPPPPRRRLNNSTSSIFLTKSQPCSSSFSASALSDDESPSPASTRALRKPPRLGATVGLLGAGAMGEALARGLLAAGALDAGGLCASVRTEERRLALGALLGASRVFGDALDGGAQKVAESSDVIVVGVKVKSFFFFFSFLHSPSLKKKLFFRGLPLAHSLLSLPPISPFPINTQIKSKKPDAVGEVLDALAPHLDVSKHLIVSIAAGLTLDAMARRLPEGARIARVMPNTPTLVGAGASVFCLNAAASAPETGDSATVRAMLGAVGLALPLDEALMDAATGLSGCGPAYVFLRIDALSDGGVKAGLPRDAATRLAAATVGGAAQMVLEAGPGRGEGRKRSDEEDESSLREMAHPAVLRERVCSPGGATIAGVAVLEDAGVRGAVARAVGAAAKRAAELASK